MTITPEREAELLASVPTGLLIGGEWREASDGGTFDVHDPATGKEIWRSTEEAFDRGVSYWESADRADRRLHAPVRGHHDHGHVHLTNSATSCSHRTLVRCISIKEIPRN